MSGVGHLDGLLRVNDSLFISEIATNGSLAAAAGKGAIYQVKALVGPPVKARWLDDQIELTWPHGILQCSSNLLNGWLDLTNGSPHRVTPDSPAHSRRFYRARN